MNIVRIWKKAHPDTLWSIWDGGNEIWELKDGHLRHFSVIERYKEGELIIEKVQLLQESPIPLEVVRQTILGWEVMEEAEAPTMIQPPQQKQRRAEGLVQEWAQGSRQQQAPAEAQVQVQVKKPHAQTHARKEAFPLLRQGPAFLPDTPEDASEHPPQQSQCQQPPFAHNSKKGEVGVSEDTHEEYIEKEGVCSQSQASQEELCSQESYNAPTELWSALSQWIPPNALFQPSLHHQAFLELSGTQEKSYHVKKGLEVNVPQKEARRPYVAPARNSRPYQPKTFVQPPRGPLFI